MEDSKVPINNNPGFVKKTVGEAKAPLPQASIVSRPLPPPVPLRGGFKDFYQANKIYFFGIAFGVVVIASLSFLAFRKQPAPLLKDANVAVSIDAPDTVPSGGNAVFRIGLQNNDPNKLIGLQLELVYPGGISFVNSSPKPANLSGSLFDVPDLISGQNAVVIVQTKVTGNINDVKTLTARLHYKFSNFNSEFIKQQQKDVRLAAADFNLDLSGPVSANNGQTISYYIKYQNNSDKAVENGKVQMTYPDGFVFDSASPAPAAGNNVWNLLSLPPASGGSIQIQGSFKSVNSGESKTAGAEFLILGQDGRYFTQSQAQFITSIAGTPLVVTQDVQTKDGSGIINPGDDLSFTLKYQNNGDTAASAVNIVLNLNSQALDFSSLHAEGAQVSGSTILWNAASSPALENVPPNGQGQMTFSIQLKNPATRDSSKNLNLSSSVKIKSNEYNDYFQGNDINLKIASPVGILTNLSYVSGPQPPKVGQTTVYKASINLSNATNDYSDGSLTAFIPPVPGFDGATINSAETGKVDFDSTTGKLVWHFGNLPAHTGGFVQARILSFNVRLNPSSSQISQSPVLVKNISLQAKDTFTQATINVTTDDISTAAAQGGNNGFGSGLVVP